MTGVRSPIKALIEIGLKSGAATLAGSSRTCPVGPPGDDDVPLSKHPGCRSQSLKAILQWNVVLLVEGPVVARGPGRLSTRKRKKKAPVYQSPETKFARRSSAGVMVISFGCR